MNIKRIDVYSDDRFSKTALYQHGAYLIAEEPYEVEIIGPVEAVVRGADRAAFCRLIDEFRFHAPHITRFFDESGGLIAEYPPCGIIPVPLLSIQPSQFFVDEDKLTAVGTFIHRAEEIVIQVLPWEGRYISLDGHTRLFLAVTRGYETVRAVISETDEWVWRFVDEAQKRGVTSPNKMQLLPHDEYVIKWDRFCDSVFGKEED